MFDESTQRARLSLAAALLTALLAFLPVGSFLHEVEEHGAVEISHCVCLVCHIGVHAPADADAAALPLGDADGVSGIAAIDSQHAPAWRLLGSAPGRSPPSV